MSQTAFWVIYQVINGARQLSVRLRTNQPADVDLTAYSVAIAIRWDYTSQEGTPEPPLEDRQRMSAFEHALQELSAGNDFSCLMSVVTGLGEREWLYYTKDKLLFMHRLNALLATHDRYPIRIEFHDDSQWAMWRDLRYGYERAGGAAVTPN